ncbi:uncharacterized protein LOC110457203 isoform X3 [Mizuhopecten yessoensis]|uniref:uncharacterized protein LOC110457203 isoform X3 n=1 Tax=Mizuhopecten yessoensis TaxID=6573 RepID=UPI000B45F2A5|nr:uncharacterized protein LOC110457203 isoform X3 [Mizuhopecten yessoensis]
MGTLLMQTELGTLETGLKDLKKSRLMGVQEFKDMYGAIEEHHRDLKLAHLTGKARDLLEKAARDTKFFHVLVKMMSEVKQLRTAKQRESLQKVHSWFMANRHTLSSRPRFGKSFQMKEAEDFKQKIMKTPRSARQSSKDNKDKAKQTKVTRLSSADGMHQFFRTETPSSRAGGSSMRGPVIHDLPSNKDYVSEYLSASFFNGSTDFTQQFVTDMPPATKVVVNQLPLDAMDDIHVLSPTLLDRPESELQRLASPHDLDIAGDTPRRELDDASNISLHYIESLISESHRGVKDQDEEAVNRDADDMEYPETRRKLSRAQTPSASIRPTITDRSSNVSNAAFLPKKMIHPIASLVNPHAQLAAQEAEQAEQEYVAARENMASSMRVLSGSKSRQQQHVEGHQHSNGLPIFRPTTGSPKIENWKSFNKDWTYGQDILSKLNFVGRSGTAVDVRYAAHDQGEAPEVETQQVLAFYTSQNQDSKQPEVLGPLPVEANPAKTITSQELEEFYQFTEGHYPSKLPKYRPYSSPNKSSTKPEVKDKKTEHKTQKVQPLGRKLLNNKENKEKQPEEKELEIVGTGHLVRLDQVVTMIDDVTEDMAHYKEKLAPTPQPGFRQPSSMGVPMRPLSRPSTATGVRSTSPVYPQGMRSASPTYHVHHAMRSTSPVQRSNTPTQPVTSADVVVSRPFFLTSNPFTSRDILIPSPDAPEHFTPRRSVPTPTNTVIQAIDWRGKITPDSMRYKWQATRFGGHTYVKNLAKSKRPVGATHAGKRPRTAPVTARERWKTEKPSDKNTRIRSQAATNSMMQVDQEAVDSMMVVQHILGSSDSRMGSYSDLFLDEEFLRSFNLKHSSSATTMANTPVPMEYLSIVSNAPRSVIGKKNHKKRGKYSRAQSRHSRFSERPDSQFQDFQLYEDEREGNTTENCTPRADPAEKAEGAEIVEGAEPLEGEAPVAGEEHTSEAERISLLLPANSQDPQATDDSLRVVEDVTTQTDDLEEELKKAFEESDDQDLRVNLQLDRPIGVITEEKSDVDISREATPIGPSVPRPVEHHSEDLHDGEVHIEVTSIPPGGRAPTPPQRRDTPLQELTKSEEWHFTPDVETDRDFTERRKVNPFYQVKGSNLHWSKLTIKPENYCFECIPDSMSTKIGRSAGRMPGRTQSASSQVLRMARKQNEYFKKAPPVRTPPSIPSPYHVQRVLKESPRYGQAYNSGLEHHARSIHSPRHFMEHVGDLRKDIRSAPAGSQFANSDPLSASLQVSRLDAPSRENTMPEMYLGESGNPPMSILREQTVPEDKLVEGREATLQTQGEATDEASKHVEFKMDNEKPTVSKTTTNPGFLSNRERSLTQTSIAHIGRPIAQYTHIGDPDEEAAAAQLQKEAKAAVDIQRICRGYVARNRYKLLIKEDREKREDERGTQNANNKKYKEHLNAKAEIYNRPPRTTEDKEWTNKVKKIKDEKAGIRQKKMEELADQNAKNFHQASSKLSVIGPHVNIYEIYHPKQVGPTKQELSHCATHIQRHIRGFLVRKKFEKLKRKAKWHGTTWQKLVRDYKGTLARCQRRHGVERARTPFTFKDMSDYMDMRRRYESVFDKKAYGGELEVTDMDQFFRECDLYPSRAEIDEGIDVILQGQINKRRGLKKSEMLELVFYIYVPKATGLKNTRQSTWMNPIIDGVEARKLLGFSSLSKKELLKLSGSEFIEPAPLDVCAKLVIDSKRERRERERQEINKQEQAKIEAIKESVRERRVRLKAPDEMSDTGSTTTVD